MKVGGHGGESNRKVLDRGLPAVVVDESLQLRSTHQSRSSRQHKAGECDIGKQKRVDPFDDSLDFDSRISRGIKRTHDASRAGAHDQVWTQAGYLQELRREFPLHKRLLSAAIDDGWLPFARTTPKVGW